MQIECYTIEEIREIIELNDELPILVMFTNLVLKTTKDRTKALQMKNIFLKSIKKDELYWYIDVIKDFFAVKTAMENQNNMQKIATNSVGQIPQLNVDYDKYYLQVKTAFYFFSENPSFYPPNFDSKDVMFLMYKKA